MADRCMNEWKIENAKCLQTMLACHCLYIVYVGDRFVLLVRKKQTASDKELYLLVKFRADYKLCGQ